MTLVDTATAALALGIQPAGVRQLVHREILTVARKDRGRNLYRLDDITSIVSSRWQALESRALA